MSRPSEANPQKLNDELRIAVDEELKEIITALAVIHGKPLAEYVRTVLSLHCYGHLGHGKRRMAEPETKRGKE